MDNIKNKIVKLLALSESSNANEAKAALLKARELMAEHKLNLTDVVPEKQPVVRATIGIFCTKMTDQWAVYLNKIVAEHYCCVAYRHIHHKGDKRAELGLIGLKDDFEICKRIMLYAFESIQSRCTEFKRNGKKNGDSGRDIRSRCNAYGWGFCAGLSDAYDRQDETHQEWRLALVPPKEVRDVVNGMTSSTFAIAAIQEQDNLSMLQGYADGRRFDPGTRIGDQGKGVALKGAVL